MCTVPEYNPSTGQLSALRFDAAGNVFGDVGGGERQIGSIDRAKLPKSQQADEGNSLLTRFRQPQADPFAQGGQIGALRTDAAGNLTAFVAQPGQQQEAPGADGAAQSVAPRGAWVPIQGFQLDRNQVSGDIAGTPNNVVYLSPEGAGYSADVRSPNYGGYTVAYSRQALNPEVQADGLRPGGSMLTGRGTEVNLSNRSGTNLPAKRKAMLS